MIKRIYYIAICTLFVLDCPAQFRLDTTQTADFLVREILLGNGVLVGDVTYKGPSFAVAYFEDDRGTMGLQNGILLTTGNVYYSLGPNRSPRTGWASNTPGDEDLNKITHGRTHDAAVLEFDFIARSENISFQYVFASEEYQEYVGSKFNDVFGFFLNGPNADHVNLAMLPDNKTPITINTVNHERGKEYYVDNPYYNTTDPFIWDVRKRKVVKNKKYQKSAEMPDFDIQYDGFTVVLTARYTVIPNEIYHIKMAVADVADGILDSGVYLAGGSFQSTGEQLVAITRQFPEMEKPERSSRGIPEMTEETLPEPVPLPEPQITPAPQVMDVLFNFDSDQLTDSAYQIVQNVSELLSHNDQLTVEVIGHTDSRGSDAYNIDLSRRRSETVIKHLLDLGVNIQRITSGYLGEAQPVGDNDHAEGRARNRRVEFVLKNQTASLN